MREILFRGKTKDGKWLYGGYYNYSYIAGDGHFINTPESDLSVIPETVGQFTGLTDKNGKKIFDGDIVAYNELHIDGKDYQEIGYFECDKHFVSFRIHGKNMTPFHCEVIGNIHDNPELLKEQQNER